MISPKTSTRTCATLCSRKSLIAFFVSCSISVILIDILADHMPDHDMTFLHPRCHLCRNAQGNICQSAHLTLLRTGQGQHSQALFLGLLKGFYDIRAIAGRRDTHQHVTFPPERLYLPAKHLIIAIIISNGRPGSIEPSRLTT